MDRIQEVNEKLGIILVIVGFALGIYLGIGHDDPNLWFLIVQWIFITAFIMTFISALAGAYDKIYNEGNFNFISLLRVFALDLAMVAVCTSFGFVFASILIGNYNTTN